MLKLDLIVGARPNFVKIASIIEAARVISGLSIRLIHTGQHYDKNLSDAFFRQLNLPNPDFALNVGSGSQAEQTAAIMVAYEKILIDEGSPNICLVVGDVNSTVACAIVAKKMMVKVAHVEAGLRSGDLSMPEEVNRILTDSITDYFFTTSKSASQNLQYMGAQENNIYLVGNTMIDTIMANEPYLRAPETWAAISLERFNYILLTLHRPSNVDDPARLKIILEKILKHTGDDPIVFPVHPRTQRQLEELDIGKRIELTQPMPYLEFNFLAKYARLIITDSGGVTEEATYFDVPCLTLRDSTERPETITEGTNKLIGCNAEEMRAGIVAAASGDLSRKKMPYRWDGSAGRRVLEKLLELRET